MTDRSIVMKTSGNQTAASVVGANPNLDYYLEGPRYKKDLLVQIYDYPTRFNYLTPIEDVLKDAIPLTMDEQGNIPLPSNISTLQPEHKLTVDARKIKKSNLKHACNSILEISDNTFSMTLNASLMDEEDYHSFISTVLLSGKLRYMVSLDLSYIPLSYKSMQEVCKFVNPIVSGYNPLKRLALTKCELKATGTTMILEALCGNNFIEELYLTSNLATDYTIDILIKLLRYSESRLKCLGYGDNAISTEAVLRIAPYIAKHHMLNHVQLHDNDMGDQGANMIFREIRDTHMMKSLNLRNCNITECLWGTRLSLLSSLSYLNLSYNTIDDEGFMLICDGLQGAFSLRSLNLAHNKFGGKTCQCISKMLIENKSLFNLDLSGNFFHHEVHAAISAGLMENGTLVELSLLRCNVPIEAANLLRKAMTINLTCNVLLDYNPLPDGYRWDSRGEALVSGEDAQSVTSSHRSNFHRKDKESSANFKKRRELVEQVTNAPIMDDDSIFSHQSKSESDITESNAPIDDDAGAADDQSLDRSAFSGDLNIYSENDKEREETFPGVRNARSSIIRRRLARRALKKKKSAFDLIKEDEEVKEQDLTIDETQEKNWKDDVNKFRNLTLSKELLRERSRTNTASSDIDSDAGRSENDDSSAMDETESAAMSIADNESIQSTESGFIIRKKEFKSSANRETSLYDFTGREINKPFPTNKDLGDRTRNMGANYRKQTSGIDESIVPSTLPSDYRLTALTTSFDWCALKIQNMQKAREALEILHSQDLDGLSGSVQMQDEKSEADSGIDGSSNSIGGDSLVEKKSLTSQHLLPQIKVTKDEREEEKRVTAIDESRGIYRELTVTYGNRLEVVGTLLVEEGTTFSMAHTMVKSMVKKYYQPTLEAIENQVFAVYEKYKEYDLDSDDTTIGEGDDISLNSVSTKNSKISTKSQKYESAHEKRLREEREAQKIEKDRLRKERNEIIDMLKKRSDEVTYLSENYYLADATGKRVLNTEANKHRLVWSECSLRNGYYLEILPANGTYIDDQDDNEMSYQNDDNIAYEDDGLNSNFGGDWSADVGDGNEEVPHYDSDDDNKTGGSSFGLMPLPSVMSDKMVPSITATNNR